MAKRGANTTGGKPVSAEEVLAGRVAITAIELIKLIHRVNPTDKDVTAAEAEARYRTKSRLQSLLIRRFPDDLEVVADAAQEGFVLLRHRYRQEDACHARIASLDEDARSWVQYQLDVGQAAGAGSAASGGREQERRSHRVEKEPGETWQTLMQSGERALEEYDYERARQDLEQALEQSHGAEGPAIALLSLFVEQLGADVEALAVDSRLSVAARKHPRIRTLLALAAARAGDERRALETLGTLAGPDMAEVFVALAEAAVRRGAFEAAGALLSRGRQCDPAHPGIVRVSAEVGRGRAAERLPMEEQLRTLFEAGADTEADTLAARILSQWPESEAARRTARAIEDRRRRREAQRLQKEAGEALSRGRAGEALAYLQRALGMGLEKAERTEVEQRIATIETEQRECIAHEAAEHIAHLLGESDRRAGLAAYAEADDSVRTRVKDRCRLPALEWMEGWLVARSGVRAAEAAEAAEALSHAMDSLESDPEQAFERMEPHRALVEAVPDGRRFMKQAAAAARARRRQDARELMQKAKVALADGTGLEEAAEGLQDPRLRDLPEEEHAALEALKALVAGEVGQQRRASRLRVLSEAGDLFGARELSDQLVRFSTGDEQRASWRGMRARIDDSIRRKLRVHVGEEWMQPPEIPRVRSSGFTSLAEDGRSLLLAATAGCWVLLCAIDLEAKQARRTMLLHAPEAMDDIQSISVGSQSIWLLGKSGAALELLAHTWEIARFYPAPEIVAADERVEEAVVIPGSRTLWITTQRRLGGPSRLRVIELGTRRTVREMQMSAELWPILGSAEPLVAVIQPDERVLFLYHARGVPMTNGKISLDNQPAGAAAHPSGQGLLVLVTRPVSGSGGRGNVGWVEISAGGDASEVRWLEESSADRHADVATALREHMGFIRFFDRAHAHCLVALHDAGGKLEPRYQARLRASAHLFQDGSGQRVAAFDARVDRIHASLLDRSPPGPFAQEEPDIHWLPMETFVHRCDKPDGVVMDQAMELAKTIRLKDVPAVQEMIGRTIKAFAKDARAVPVLYFALRETRYIMFADRLVEEARRHYKPFPELQMLHANRLVMLGLYDEAVEELRGLDPRTLLSATARHYYHMLALSWLMLGRAQEAAGCIDEAMKSEGGHCDLTDLSALCKALAGSIDLRKVCKKVFGLPGPSHGPCVHVVAAACEADRCLDRGDVQGALKALSIDAVWIVREVQSLARLAHVWLEREPANQQERIRKIWTLANYCEVQKEWRPERRRALPIPTGTWDADRLTELAARSNAWLAGVEPESRGA